ncbi:DUF4395 domain-containing protein [Mucilaginibacter paludis]|uniref:Cdp-alcohol phosphatidyltransferase n=1 Tax=Mucilaginibacter paludis DSM 18603 TaxID=714943 RepID=H1Y547_9SPHI|nr:DUF4395 domain-containing protein [Mucilaginibacter paludis]EHQ28590.1 cdp-alcohol phosphatidyltransferase [Mucilaginibacter paludis DSM 18603]
MNNDISCPVDFVLINENRVRLVASFVLLSGVAYIISGLSIIIIFLVIDFLLRSFNMGRYSLLAIIAGVLINWFKIKNKPVDQAPKRFAARIGLAFTSTIILLHLFQFGTGALALTIILCLFAALESFVGFCAGCHAYSIYHKLARKFSSSSQL